MTRTGERLVGWLEHRHAVPAIFALALLIRCALLLALPQVPYSDGEWYLVRAVEMARGMGYQEAGHPTAFWPVGYPALLAGSLWALGAAGPLVVNLLGTAATLALVLWFARALGLGPDGGRVAGRLAALLYALYPSAIVYTGQTTSEIAATALGTAAFALLVAGRRTRALGGWALPAAGVAFGLGTLMRTQLLLFPAGAVLLMMLAFRDFGWRRALVAAGTVYLALFAVVLPWTARNARVMHAPVLVSTNGGMSLYTGANDMATGEWTPWEHTWLWDRTGIPFSQRVERQVELDAAFRRLSKEWIAAHPVRWTALGFRKMALVWRKDSDAFWSLDRSYPGAPLWLTLVGAANQLYYLLLLALGGIGIAAGVRAAWARDPARAPMLMLVAMPAFATVIAFGFTGQVRYHFPAMPFVALAAGWTLAGVLRRAEARGRVALPA